MPALYIHSVCNQPFRYISLKSNGMFYKVRAAVDLCGEKTDKKILSVGMP
jgi:hypothetical protein